MPSKASITLIGHLGSDPEQRFAANGNPITTVNVPVNDGRKRKDGEGYEDHSSWYRVTAFGRTGELLAERGRKGTLVMVHGSLATSLWQPQQGEPRVSLDVLADTVLVLERKEEHKAPGTQASLDTPFDDDAELPF